MKWVNQAGSLDQNEQQLCLNQQIHQLKIGYFHFNKSFVNNVFLT